MSIQNILESATADNKYKKYNTQVLPILERLKDEHVIEDYQLIKDGGSEFVSIIQILDKGAVQERPADWGRRLSEIFELGYSLGLTDDEMCYATASKFGIKTIPKMVWEKW